MQSILMMFVWIGLVGSSQGELSIQQSKVMAGSWVIEFLTCMETAVSGGLSRDEARQQCGENGVGTFVWEQVGVRDQATCGYGYWVIEYLTCMETAVSGGLPRDEARQQCGQGFHAASSVRGQDHFGSWVIEYLTCMETAVSGGLPRDEARQQCGDRTTGPR